MARQTFHPVTGGVGWIDPATGQGRTPQGGSFTFTPGSDPNLVLGAIGVRIRESSVGGAITNPHSSGGSSSGGTSAAASTPAATGEQASTIATISGYLRAMGLEELIPHIDGLVRAGRSWPEIELMLSDPTTPLGQIVDGRFPELREYRTANPGQPPLTVAAVQNYRQGLSQMVSQRGLTEAFPDITQTARRWLVQNKGLPEIANRLDLLEGQVAGLASSPEVQQQLEAWERFYGVTPTLSNLVSLVINPDESVPRLQKKFTSVRFDVAAGREGFGDLSVNEAERLADAGLNPQGSEQTFGALARSRELFTPLDRGEDAITRDEQLNAGFSLSNGDAARRRIEQRAARRRAQFQGGGGFAQTRSGGFGGLSTAQ